MGYLSFDDAMSRLGMSESEVQDAVARGDLREVREGDRLVFHPDDVQKLANRRSGSPQGNNSGPGAFTVPVSSGGGAMKILGIGVLAVLLAVGGFFGCAYSKRNQIIGLDETANAKWGTVESTYQRRLDLIPNLVATVEGATKYEGETMTKIVEKRNTLLGVVNQVRESYKDPSQGEKTDRLNSDLIGAVRAFTGVATEAYPQLRATAAFSDLMSQIEGTENRINVARNDYNDSVAAYNAMVRQWGWMPFCGGNQPRTVFKAAPDAQNAPKVKF